MEFIDAWGEGDAERVYCCWRLFLKATFCGISSHKVCTSGSSITVSGERLFISTLGSSCPMG